MSRKGNAATFDEQLERIHCSAGTRTQAQLAAFLGIRQSSISDGKKRQFIPAEWLLRLLRLKGINPDWILTGRGPRLLVPVDTPDTMTIYVTEIRPPDAYTTQELVTELVRRSLDAIP